jgi:hypothetical protein
VILNPLAYIEEAQELAMELDQVADKKGAKEDKPPKADR